MLPKITKRHNNRLHTSSKITPIQASFEKNEGFVYQKIDKRKKEKPKLQVKDLVRAGDSKKTFSKRDSTNSFYKLYKITEIFNDTIPSYRIDNLSEKYNEPILEKNRFISELN